MGKFDHPPVTGIDADDEEAVNELAQDAEQQGGPATTQVVETAEQLEE